MFAGNGCIISGDDDDDGDVTDDTTDGTSSGCEEVLATGDGMCFSVAVECPAGAATYTVFTVDTTTGESFDDTINCGTIGAILVDAGSYDVRVESSSGGVNFGYLALENETGINGDALEVDFELEVGNGFFFAIWDIVDLDDNPLTCDEVEAAGLGVLSSGPEAVDDILKCHYFGWQTGELALGEYEVEISLIDDNDALIEAGPTFPADLIEHSELVDLPEHVFVFE
jgi:hypothetical protein